VILENISLRAFLCAAMGALLLACGKHGGVVLSAERKAQVGGEFIRCYKDGTVEYGYGVVKENLKATGTYRYAHDTLFLSDSFKEHFPAGYLPVKGDVLYMESGLHFEIKKNALGP
jgi:hypothetical protein